jgi:hypothetical protein
VRKSGFRRDGGVSVADGTSGSHDQLSEKDTIPTSKMVRFRRGVGFITLYLVE